MAVEFDYIVTAGTDEDTVENTSLPELEDTLTSYLALQLIDACGSSAAADIVGIDTAPTDQVLVNDNGTAVECDTTPSSSDCFRIHSEFTIYVSTTASGVDSAFETSFDDYVSNEGSGIIANTDYNVTIYTTTSAPSASPTEGAFSGCTETLGEFMGCTSDCFEEFSTCYSDLIDEIAAFKDENTIMYFVIISVIVLIFFCCIFACCKCCHKEGDDDEMSHDPRKRERRDPPRQRR